MNENEVFQPELDYDAGRAAAVKELIAGLSARGWRGRLSQLEPIELDAFRWESLVYARWEISQYAKWRGQDEPVLADGFDAEAVVQASFAWLLSRESGSVQIFYTVEDVRRELRSRIKHRVRWLNQRAETRLVVGEWDVLPTGEDGELVSVFDYMPGQIPRPDEEVMAKEQEKVLGEFKAGFEKTLGNRQPLLQVFERVWAGERRRKIARQIGTGVERIKDLQRQVKGRLAKFAARATGAVAEVLLSFKKG